MYSQPIQPIEKLDSPQKKGRSESLHSDLSTVSVNSEKDGGVHNVASLATLIDELFALKSAQLLDHDGFKERVLDLFGRVDLKTSEINKYTFWDSQKPYTRNLVATDGKHYSLLLLCWNAGKESKVHNHPGDGCYLKTVRGSIRETRYQVDPVTDEILPSSVKFLSEGQCKFCLNSYIFCIVSLTTHTPTAAYIDDSLGLHKIGNPCPDVGAVTLHLYTPPFKSCKVWTDLPIAPTTPGTRLRTSVNDPTSSPPTHAMYYKDSQDATVGFFSVYGVRTPHLEGTYAHFRRLMTDLLNKA